MQKCIPMDWDDLRIFLAIARAGSLTGAAQALGVNQSTVSRRLAAMEAHLRARLFDRGPGGLALTGAGSEIVATAEQVEQAFIGIDRRVAGRDEHVSGRLLVTCTPLMANQWLAPHCARFLQAHPNVDLELETSVRHANLARRAADVALRATADPPETLIGRKVLRPAFAVYAAAPLAESLRGEPAPGKMDWIGWGSDTNNRIMITPFYPDARIRHRVDDLQAMLTAARAGIGPAVLPCYAADPEPRLARVYAEPIRDTKLDWWVLWHPDVRHTAAVRAFTRYIHDAFLADRDLFRGARPAEPLASPGGIR